MRAFLTWMLAIGRRRILAPGVVTPERIVFATKGLRMLGDGLMGIGLAQLIVLSGISNVRAGMLASAALVGTSLGTLLVGRYVERIGRRRVLRWGAIFTVVTGVAYALVASEAYWLMVGVGFLGTFNPTEGDVSALLPIEQTILAQQTRLKTRVRAFASFNVVGAVGGAIGSLLTGSTQLLEGAGMSRLEGIKVLFLGYSVIGALTWLLVRRLPKEVELAITPTKSGLGASRRRVLTLSALFGLDAFAGGLAVRTLTALFLFRKFGAEPATTATVFFVVGLLAALSYPISARFSVRWGVVRTMVFSHLPANLLFFGLALAPNLPTAVGFMLARALISQMDVAPRQALVVSLVNPEERAAAAAVTGVARSIAATPAPSLGGILLGSGASGAPFMLAGTLKSIYDLALWAGFGKAELRD